MYGPRPPLLGSARGAREPNERQEQARATDDQPWQGLTIEASELIVCDPAASPVLSDAFLYQPEPDEEALGSLVLTLETINLAPSGRNEIAGEEQTSPARALLDTIAATIRDEYYRDPRRDMLTSFEAALTAANVRLAAYATRGESDWLTNLQGTVAVFRDRMLHLSRVGSSSLFLARRGHLTDIGEGLSDPNVRNPKAAFTNIASGTVAEHDSLALTGTQLFRFLPRDRLGTFLIGKHPRDVVSSLRDLIAESADPIAFATVFVRFTRAPIVLPAPRSFGGVGPAPGGIYPSKLDVGPTLREDSRRPRVLPRTPLRIKQRWHERARTLGRRALVLAWMTVTTKMAPIIARAGRAGARTAKSALATTSASAKGLLAKTGTAGSGRERPHFVQLVRRPGTLVTKARAAPRQLRVSMAGWPRSTKIFSLLTLVLAVLFVGSLLLLRQKRAEDAAIRGASEQLQGARVKKDAADAALIYDNTDQARQLLQEARASATAVQQGAFYHAEATALLTAIQATEDTTERIMRVTEPARVGDFRSVAPDGRTTGLAVVGTNLFAFHPETNAIFRLSIENGETTTVSQRSQGIGYFRAVTPLTAEQMLLFTTDAPGLALFDAARGDLLKQDVDALPENTKEIRALATFGSRLYLLLPETKQIYGYSKTLAGFSGGTPWLKDAKIAADRAVGMGVDGYIYLLMDDGKITKLLKGAPVDFAQSALTTPLKAPTRLVINDTLKFLYVLDPAEKRVVVYDTTGKLSRQLVFPFAQDLRDITVGGKDEILYALEGTSVFKVPLK